MTTTPGSVLLHIGTAKTGTTSIQHVLAEAQARGRLGGVSYPMPQNDSSQARLVNLYLTPDQLPRFHRAAYIADSKRFEADQRQYRRNFFRALRKNPNAVISSENFSLLPESAVYRLRHDLEDAGVSEILVVLYVRDPADYYLSQVQQTLKASSQLPNPDSFRYTFRRVASTWERVFPGCVQVRRYLSGPGFDVVEDFSKILREHLGVSVTPTPKRLNATISAEGMAILQNYRSTFHSARNNIFTADTNRLVEFLEASLRDLPQTRPSLKPELTAMIRRNHRDDLDFLDTRYGLDLVPDDADAPPAAGGFVPEHVTDILSECDRELMNALLLRLAKSGLDRPVPKGVPGRRIAARLLRK